MNIKTENWNGHEIRFVEVEPSEWWAVAGDVAKSLGYSHTPTMVRRLDEDEKSTVSIRHIRSKNGVKQTRKVSIISEIGIYEAIFGSELKEAKSFKKWVKEVIKELRQQSGLEGFQIFRMLDKEHQKETMSKLSQSLKQPKRINFIKANVIANKAVSTKYGYEKMIKKKDMTPDMLLERQPILDDTVNLMSVVDRFDLDLSVSEKVYKKYVN